MGVVKKFVLSFFSFVCFSTTCRAISHPSGSCVGCFARIDFGTVTARQFLSDFSLTNVLTRLVVFRR